MHPASRNTSSKLDMTLQPHVYCLQIYHFAAIAQPAQGKFSAVGDQNNFPGTRINGVSEAAPRIIECGIECPRVIHELG